MMYVYILIAATLSRTCRTCRTEPTACRRPRAVNVPGKVRVREHDPGLLYVCTVVHGIRTPTSQATVIAEASSVRPRRRAFLSPRVWCLSVSTSAPAEAKAALPVQLSTPVRERNQSHGALYYISTSGR
ncbi:hypothetical protein GGR52DRAFT_550214 [Hypoxylon sp. FL1284]|nr:hypothetical protein GGR52DRAFT_550214 [Hypoxylon sp. FL1284]